MKIINQASIHSGMLIVSMAFGESSSMETPNQASIHSEMLIVSMAFGESSSMHNTQDEVYICVRLKSKPCDCCCVMLLQPAAAKYFSSGQPGLLPAAAYFFPHPQDVSGCSHASITSCCTHGEPGALVVIL